MDYKKETVEILQKMMIVCLSFSIDSLPEY